MRNKLVTYFAAISLAALSIAACDKQDDTYRQYIVNGGYNYPAKPTNLTFSAGYYKVVLSWGVPLDPAVKSVKVYWDNYSDSVSLDYSKAKDGVLSTVITKLEERSYTFDIVNFDGHGNRSLSAETTVSPYGEGWLSTHAERSVSLAVMDADSAVVSMGSPRDEMVYTKFRYRDVDGNLVESAEIPADQMKASLPNALKGKYFEYKSAYRPEGGIDAVWNESWTKSNSPILYNLSNPSWTVGVTKNQYRDATYLPSNLFDGNLETQYFSSQNTTIRKSFPKIVVVDTGASEDNLPVIAGISFVQHPELPKSRYIRAVNFYVGNDPYNPDDTNYLNNYGKSASEFILTTEAAIQSKFFSPTVSGRYYAIAFKNSYNSSGFISAYEIYIYGYYESEAN